MLKRLLILVIAASAGACASAGGVPRPFPGAAVPPGATERAPERAEAPADPAEPGTLLGPGLISTALSFRGIPYRNGGSDPSGFDCSGFVQYVYAMHGTRMPREVRDQYQIGRTINRDDIEPGDLVFFETVSRGASHVGLVVGKDEFVHAPSSRGVVRIEHLSTAYWAKRFVGARRLNEPASIGLK